MSWYELEAPQVNWLVYGLIPSDGHVSICGKPKAGKSTFTRSLVSSIIKGHSFLGRTIELGEGTGRVLYVHLDRKDTPARVATEFRQLGITKEESFRLIFKTAQDIPDSFEERLSWLKKEILDAKPHLIVIDLMWQFIVAANSNDYNQVLKGINDLQDALSEASYKGALLVTMHGRKATNPNEPFDDILGSTGQRGSFSTNIMLNHYRREKVYTIMSDQTERETAYGEIEETILQRDEFGTLSLSRPFADLAKESMELKEQTGLVRLLSFIANNQGKEGCTMENILAGLGMSKKTVLKLFQMETAA